MSVQCMSGASAASQDSMSCNMRLPQVGNGVFQLLDFVPQCEAPVLQLLFWSLQCSFQRCNLDIASLVLCYLQYQQLFTTGWLFTDGSSRLVTSLHATASGSLEAEGHGGVGVRVGKQHATPAYQQGLQASVSSMVPAHLRLHQVSHLSVRLLCVCTAALTVPADA